MFKDLGKLREKVKQEQAEQAAESVLKGLKGKHAKADQLIEKAGGAEGLAKKLGGLFKK
jgi:hypothetical protein